MTWTLIREQLRARRGYAGWSAALIALAAGLSAFVWATVISSQAFSEYSWAMRGGGHEYNTQIALVDAADGLESLTDWGVPMTSQELATLVADANAEGAEAVSSLEAWGLGVEGMWGPDGGVPHEALIMSGEVPWPTILASGEAPGAGEVVVQASIAERLGASIGSSVDVTQTSVEAGEDSAVVATRTISGIAYNDGGDMGRGLPGVFYLSEADVPLAVEARRVANADFPDDPITLTLRWNHSTPQLEAAIPDNAMWTEGTGGITADMQWAILALVVTAGLIVMAFAVGRAQAQDRARWTATARALGATRGRVAGATLVEGVVIGLVGGLIGLMFGIGAAAVSHAASLASLTAPPPVPFTVTAALVVAVMLGAVALGLVIAGVPAFLGSRVPPSAALKDVPAIDETEVTRRVSLIPVAVICGAAYLGTLWIVASYGPQSGPWFILSGLAVLVSGFALLIELSRRAARWLGRSLTARAEPAAVRAGIEMTGHPRQPAALIAIQALTFSGLTAAACSFAIGSSELGWLAHRSGSGLFDALVGPARTQLHWEMALAIALIAQALCAAVFVGTGRISRADDATAQALGLDSRGERAGRALRYALPQATGMLAGAVLTLPLAGLLLSVAPPVVLRAPAPGVPSFLWSLAVAQALIIVAIGLVVLAVATMLQVARRSPARTPAPTR